MNKLESLEIFRPFKNLKSLLKNHDLPMDNGDLKKKDAAVETIHRPLKDSDDTDEKTLFLEAMADVKPISRRKTIKTGNTKAGKPPSDAMFHTEEDREVTQHLSQLVTHGIGFEVSSTPEYIEGTNYNVHPEISKRLHKGVFSIQAHIDLHGLSVSEAGDAFNELFKTATSAGLRGLLIIHGRGLSSPGKPVLKAKVYEWLTYGPWRKWVIAFSSARACDGGAGATYVLLRKNPLTKRHRKKHLKTTNIC